MPDIKKEREALVAEIELFITEAMKAYVVDRWANSYQNTEPFAYVINEKNEIWWLKTQAHQLWQFWQSAKVLSATQLKDRVVEPVWVATNFLLPDEGEIVLFIDNHNVIHEGFISTDYVDGPYGENGEDFGGDKTLWSSNSNGWELLPDEVKYWMKRPDSPLETVRG
ncbi:hypothetical protein J522_1899 [Acinetobacter baumannii 146457]|nr:hypothetical protein J522_1899 [Acinetobacter baumannii 146457]